MRPSPLPVELGPGPFSTAEARGLGVPAQRLSRGDPVHPTRGVHALADPCTLLERARAYQRALPDERAFSHVTAAVLWGLPLPSRVESAAARVDAPLHVIAPTGDGAVVRRGVVGHRGLERRAVASPPGYDLRVVDVADTWCDLGELHRGVLSMSTPTAHGAARTPSVVTWSRANDWRVKELWAEDIRPGPRHRWTLTSFAVALDLDPATRRIT